VKEDIAGNGIETMRWPTPFVLDVAVKEDIAGNGIETSGIVPRISAGVDTVKEDIAGNGIETWAFIPPLL